MRNETLRYSYNVFWSDPDGEFVAECVEIPGLSGLGATASGALHELETAIYGWLDYLSSAGKQPPKPSELTGGLIVTGVGIALTTPARKAAETVRVSSLSVTDISL